jgi:nucleoside-diphosphate-sugar epimerase
MNIALSGSHGFIGSHLKDLLESQGHKIFPIDRDLLYAPYALESYLQKIHPEVIIHAAAYGNMATHTDEDEIFDANITKTYNLLQASFNIPYTHFLFISTSSVMLPVQTLYSATKQSSEVLCRYFRQEGKNIGIIRPFTVIGTREPREHLVPKLIESCLTGEEMPFVRSPRHDVIDVRDFCSALSFLIHKKTLPPITQIGRGLSVSNLDLLDIVEELTNKKVNTRIVDSLRAYDREEWKADTTILDDLGWKPHYSLEETIQEMIDYAS